MRCRYPFNLIIKPAGSACNLHCDYCYYLTKADIVNQSGEVSHFIDDRTLELLVKSYIESQPEGASEVIFNWQGGEPTLMGIGFYQKVLKLQKTYAGSMRVLNALQTNGTLITDEFASFFADNGFLIGVSLDGPEHIHNHYRHYPDGRGSFADVMRGYERLRAADVEVNTLTVIQHHNAKYAGEVYEFLCSIDSPYMQFIPVVERIDGMISDRSVDPGQFGSFLTTVFDSWVRRDIGKRYVQLFETTFGRYCGQPAQICVHSQTCGRALVIEHNGRLYSCDHFVDDEHYLGNLTETELSAMVDSQFQYSFGESKASTLASSCLRCPYYGLCAGGCIRNRVPSSGGRSVNYLCEGYYRFFEHADPYFQAMRRALEARRPAVEFPAYFDYSTLSRNAPCPCGSGKKVKHCHGKNL